MANEVQFDYVIHPGPHPEVARQYLAEAWAKMIMKRIKAMNLNQAELRDLRRCFGFEEDK